VVTVETVPGAEARLPWPRRDLADLRRLVINPDDLARFYPPARPLAAGDGAGYVVVTVPVSGPVPATIP